MSRKREQGYLPFVTKGKKERMVWFYSEKIETTYLNSE